MDPRKVRPEMNALVTELLERLATSGVSALEVRRNGLRVKVSKDPLFAAPSASTRPSRPIDAPPQGAAPEVSVPHAGVQITAPLTGIFYRSPSPQAGPFVQVGSVVGNGDVVALIEAMKLFNEIRADKSGVVRSVLVESGQLVKKHQPLFELDPV